MSYMGGVMWLGGVVSRALCLEGVVTGYQTSTRKNDGNGSCTYHTLLKVTLQAEPFLAKKVNLIYSGYALSYKSTKFS